MLEYIQQDNVNEFANKWYLHGLQPIFGLVVIYLDSIQVGWKNELSNNFKISSSGDLMILFKSKVSILTVMETYQKYSAHQFASSLPRVK